MRIVQITPGAGGMYCGVCARDNALVACLRKLGHEVVMVPLYLPFTLDEPDQSTEVPIFFSGINVYLGHKSALFRSAPEWLRRIFASRSLLKWIGSKAAGTHPSELGDLTLSMLMGENGKQNRELDELIAWLKSQGKPDVICLSTALLAGMGRRLRAELNAPVLCTFQGEDVFLDALSQPHSGQCWNELATRAKEADGLISPSRFYAEFMGKRLSIEPSRFTVVPNGISTEGFHDSTPSVSTRNSDLTLGFFARMCGEKGLDLLIDAYIAIRKRGKVSNLKLRVGGACSATDAKYVDKLKHRLSEEGLLQDAEFCPNLDRSAKIAFLESLSVMSVPARFGEAFGLYVVEAMAAGVPIVQPRLGAFPELVESNSAGLVFEAGNADAYIEALESVLLDESRRKAMSEAGKAAVAEKFNAKAMAENIARVYASAGSRADNYRSARL
jgi:glycosyltransferase involved in cell wall biosynthesis